MLTYFQAVVLGIVQGVAELFPVSSLGHSVLIADLFGWHDLSNQLNDTKSPLLTFLAMTHIAVATALIIFYRQQWVQIVRGFARSVRTKQIGQDSNAKLAWLLIVATAVASIMGLLFEHRLRLVFASAFFAIIFTVLNGIMLIKGDKIVAKAEIDRPRKRRDANARDADASEQAATKTLQELSDHFSFRQALLIGVAQTGALFAGISRSGITMLAGLRSGLGYQDAARFAFLLTTLIILAAGLYKLPDILSGAGNGGMHGPMLLGSLLAGISAYFSVRFLDNYFKTKSLRPFGWYCIGFGIFMLLVSIIKGA